MNNRRDFSRLFVFRYNKRVAFLKNALFCFVSLLFVRSIALYFNKIEIIIKLVG